MSDASRDARSELALACGLLRGSASAVAMLTKLLGDADPGVREHAIRGAARTGSPELGDRLVAMLDDPGVRRTVKRALASGSPEVRDLCRRRLADPEEEVLLRRRLARVLGHTPEQATVDVLQDVAADPRSPWAVRFAGLKALNKLRASEAEEIEFDRGFAVALAAQMAQDAERYALLGEAAAGGDGATTPGLTLLRSAALEAGADRREAVYRSLGLVFPANELYRCHGTLEGTDDRRKANALEWLERTLGHTLFGRLRPVLEGRPGPGSPQEQLDDESLTRLAAHSDPWIAELAEHARAGRAGDGGPTLDLIAKTFLLQKVDLLEGARSSHLGLLAGIAEEVEADPGEELVKAGEPNDALYVIVRGSAELSGVGDQKLTAGEGTAFGTWSLIDSAPSVVGARLLEHTRLLRITRSDFQELLSDNPELAAGMLQALARRLRTLVA